MPTDAVWILATVPQKNFERRLITFNNKLDNIADDKFFDEYYEENANKRLYMEKILEDALEYLNIHDSVWMSSKNGHYYHVYFTCDLDSNDHAMHYLKSRGVGSKRNSAVGYIPFGLFYYNEKPDPNDPYNYNSNYFNEIKDNFLKSVTSRLTVAQVVEGVEAGAAITFDYYMYLLWSSTIAAMGIMNNAPVDVAASMCIEPLMGSVMAISFGLALWKKSVLWTGIKSLVVGIIFCLIFGYLYGMIFQIWRVAWNPPPDGTWPTSEMQSRGEYRTLIYGSVIATSGGAILAVILLKNNIVAMTGVAIATTFMPPMVNAGLCFALATHIQIVGTWQDYENITIDGSVHHFKPAWAPPPGYTPDWMYDMRYECCILAVISIAYTFVNVFFLLFASYIILKIKEIAPIKNLMPSDHKFFSEDIKIYRAHNRKYPSNTNIGQQILEEWADISGINKNDLLSDHPDAKATQLQTLSDIVADVEADANYQTITRHAFGNKYQPHLRRRLTQPQVDNSGITANLRNTALNNLGVYTVERGGGGGSRRGSQSGISGSDMPSGFNDTNQGAPFGFASIRRSQRNPLRYSVNSPYSVWPSSNVNSGGHQQHPLAPPPPPNLVRNRSRSSSTASGQIYGQINNNLGSSKL